MRARRLAAITVTGLALTVSACASSTKSTSGDASSTRSTAHGTPIVLGLIVDLTAPAVGGGLVEVKQAEQAAVTAINAAGGVNGHPLQLKVCDSQLNPNQVTACAREMVSDQQVVATVGNVTTANSPTPVLQAGKLANFANFAFEPPDEQDSVSFPIFSPIAGAECAASIGVKYEKPKPTHSGWAYLNAPGQSEVVSTLKPVVTALGSTLTNVVPISPSSSDLTPSVASVTKGVTSIGVSLTPGEDEQFITQARSSGYTGAIGTLSLGTSQIKALGSAGNGVYVCEPFKPATDSFAGGKEFLQQTAGISGFSVGTDSVNAWIGVHMLADALQGMKTINRATVLAKLSGLHNASTFGFSLPYSADKPYTGLGAAAPRLMARAQYYTQVENGKLDLLSAQPGHF